MTPKLLPLLERCIEDGVSRGWARAHKYKDKPTPEEIREAIEECIRGEIHEWFAFTDEELGCSSNE